MTYHITQQEFGFQFTRAANLLMMLLGAMGAVGGTFTDFKWTIHKNYKALDEVKVKDPPYNIFLKDSKYFPINSANPSVGAKVMLEPAQSGGDYVPAVLILHMPTPGAGSADPPKSQAAYRNFKVIAAIAPWLSETADLFADVVLPAA